MNGIVMDTDNGVGNWFVNVVHVVHIAFVRAGRARAAAALARLGYYQEAQNLNDENLL